jgi:two-component system phosphate regulon sensor histidine kinase PhoR
MDEAVKLKNQVERVLSIADSESKMKINAEIIDMNELINKITSQLLDNSSKKVAFNFIAGAKNAIVNGDKLHLGNLISNLVDNSIKYSYDDVHITITTKNKTPDTLEIQVTDNGVGISKENQKKIFDKFYRVPTGNIHNAKGFGIGLNYVALITKAHKGTIMVQSEEKAGATFIITLPTV